MELSKAYRLLSPRPVWLITTVDRAGRINAAPFSFATPVEIDPPLVLFSCDPEHDTYKNIKETKEFVINIPTSGMVRKVLICGNDFPRGVNELEKAGLSWRKAGKVRPPLVNECPISLECRFVKEYEKGIIVGEVVAVHKRKTAGKVKPLMHITGKKFTTTKGPLF